MKLAGLKLARLLPVVLCLSACGASAGSPQSELTLHEQDSGRTVSLHAGDTVNVDLLDTFPVPGSSVTWTAEASDPAVLARVSTSRETPAGISHSQAHYRASFRALKSGSTTIRLIGAARCEAMNPSACPQRSGAITIIVA